MINILYIAVAGGGAGKSFAFVVKHTKDLFDSTTILIHKDEDNPGYRIDNEKLLYFESCNATMTRHGVISKIHNYLLKIACVKSMIKKHDINVIIVFTSSLMIVSKLATIGWKGLLIGSERGMPQSKGFITRVLSKLLFNLYDGIVFQTETIRDFYGKHVKKISTIIPNAYFPKSGELLIYKGVKKKVISAAGRLCVDKGYDVLLEAFSIVVKKHPDYLLKIYGSGSEYDSLNNQIKFLNLSDKAFLCGFKNNIEEAINESSMFVLSSRTEGIPNVLLEAMGAGVPCIATDCESGGPKMLFANGTKGLLVNVNDVSGLACAMNKYIEDPCLARKLSRTAMDVAELYSSKIISNAWSDFVSSKLTEKGMRKLD